MSDVCEGEDGCEGSDISDLQWKHVVVYMAMRSMLTALRDDVSLFIQVPQYLGQSLGTIAHVLLRLVVLPLQLRLCRKQRVQL